MPSVTQHPRPWEPSSKNGLFVGRGCECGKAFLSLSGRSFENGPHKAQDRPQHTSSLQPLQQGTQNPGRVLFTTV